MERPQSIAVTDQEISLSDISPQAWEYIEQLAQSIASRYIALGKARAVFALAGPAGAGKSVLSAILADYFQKSDHTFQFINVGIDAYHFPQETLFRWGLDDHKGRYDTYDLESLESDLVAFKQGDLVRFPKYSRKLHDPIPQNLPTEDKNALLWLEGQWLLYGEDEWARLVKMYDYSYDLSAPEETLAQRVISRHKRGGRSEDKAKDFFESSDAHNIRLVLEKSLSANEKLRF